MYSHIKAEQGKIRFLSQILQHLYRNADYLYIVGVEVFHRIVFRVQAETLMLLISEYSLQCSGLNYTGTPPKPKRRIDDKPENPEGESLRGSLIFTTEASVDIYSYQGIKKNRPEPKFKGVCKKSVLIEI